MTRDRIARVVWWAMVATMVPALLPGVFHPPLGIDAYPIYVVAPLALVILFGELGVYPFKGRWIYHYNFAFYALLFLMTGPFNALANSDMVPDWFPPGHMWWLVGMWAGLGVYMLVRRYQLYGERPTTVWDYISRTQKPEPDKDEKAPTQP